MRTTELPKNLREIFFKITADDVRDDPGYERWFRVPRRVRQLGVESEAELGASGSVLPR